MGKLSELLRWKREVKLMGPNGEVLETVYMRIIGDYDLQEAYRLARIASAAKRERLRDTDTEDFKDQVAPFNEASEDECKQLIRVAREAGWTPQALSAVIRPDEVKISEIATDPDAPTLEEQERVDKENADQEEKYQKELQDFIEQKRKELEADLSSLSSEQIRVLAQAEATVWLPLTVYMNELTDEKTWRSVYTDKAMTERGFANVQEFREMMESLRSQLIQAYAELEESAGDIKN